MGCLACGSALAWSHLPSALPLHQETLKQQLKNIEEARARNAEYQRKIKALIVQSQKKTARKPGKRSFTAPYFATVGGEVRSCHAPID